MWFKLNRHEHMKRKKKLCMHLNIFFWWRLFVSSFSSDIHGQHQELQGKEKIKWSQNKLENKKIWKTCKNPTPSGTVKETFYLKMKMWMWFYLHKVHLHSSSLEFIQSLKSPWLRQRASVNTNLTNLSQVHLNTAV